MRQDTWDLVVIGTGGAAMAAGIEARARGKQVLLVERGPLGGTCLNVGCVPSKNLLAAAGQRHRALANREFPMVPTSATVWTCPRSWRRSRTWSTRCASTSTPTSPRRTASRSGTARLGSSAIAPWRSTPSR